MSRFIHMSQPQKNGKKSLRAAQSKNATTDNQPQQILFRSNGDIRDRSLVKNIYRKEDFEVSTEIKAFDFKDQIVRKADIVPFNASRVEDEGYNKQRKVMRKKKTQ